MFHPGCWAIEIAACIIRLCDGFGLAAIDRQSPDAAAVAQAMKFPGLSLTCSRIQIKIEG